MDGTEICVLEHNLCYFSAAFKAEKIYSFYLLKLLLRPVASKNFLYTGKNGLLGDLKTGF